MVTGSDDGTIALWDWVSGTREHTLIGHEAPVTAVAFTPSGDRIVSGDRHGRVLVWSTARAELIAQRASYGNRITSIEFGSGITRDALVCDSDYHVRLLDLDTGHTTTVFRILGAMRAAFVPFWDRVVVARCFDAELWNLWNPSGPTRKFQPRSSGFVHHIGFLDSKHLVTAGNHGDISIWYIESGHELAHFPPRGALDAMAVTSDGRIVCVPGFEGQACSILRVERP